MGCSIIRSDGSSCSRPRGYTFALIPVVTADPLPGGFGTLWDVEVTGWNDADEQVQVFQDYARFFCRTLIQGPCGTPVPAHARFSGTDLILYPQWPGGGAYLGIQRRFADQVWLQARLYDRNATATSFGTELPIVREGEFHRGRLELLNVPVSTVHRATLRVYSPPGFAPDHVLVSVSGIGEATPFLQFPLPLHFSGFPFNRWIDIANDPRIAGNAAVRISVEAPSGEPIWAFVSVTNNETQHVTIITPQ